ncbi:MAG TPA: response regulator [Aggregatilineales bacterium]|nr:response regulator [Aggregatilineales bacterium]
MASRIGPPCPSALIVDDDSPIRELFRFVLTNVGYEVFEAADGEQALELLRFRSFALMLLDLQMPHVGGKAVLVAVRQMFLHDRMRIAIVTADALRLSDEIRAIADRVMIKPLDIRDLMEYARQVAVDAVRVASALSGANGLVPVVNGSSSSTRRSIASASLVNGRLTAATRPPLLLPRMSSGKHQTEIPARKPLDQAH